MDSRQDEINLLAKNPALRKVHEERALRYKIARLLMRGRAARGLTQEQLARRVGTKQPAIARIENASLLPSLDFLEKVAKALDTYLIEPNFGFLDKSQVTASAVSSVDLFSEYVNYNPALSYVGRSSSVSTRTKEGF